MKQKLLYNHTRRKNLQKNYDIMPVRWFDNDVVLSSFWNALSITFPEGEKFFVSSVKHYQDKIVNDELKEEIKAFIMQEAAHSKEHKRLNFALKESGFSNVDELENEVKQILAVADRLPPNIKLAITCALEHFTAILAEQLILDSDQLRRIDYSVRNLWAWHAVEESEHKHVAFDVYQQCAGNYAVRVLTMLVVSLALGLVAVSFQVRLLYNTYSFFDLDAWSNTHQYFWSQEGLIPKLIPLYLEYFSPNFHPNKNDSVLLLTTRKKIIQGLYD